MCDIERDILFHTSILNKAEKITEEILRHLDCGDIDSVINHVDNRDRLVNIAITMNNKIKAKLKHPKASLTDQSDTVKNWISSVKKWSSKQSQDNVSIEKYLINTKNVISQEIATIFDQKSRHRGYDLSTMK